MPKYKLIFDMDNIDEKREFELAHNGKNAFFALNEIAERLRKIEKYDLDEKLTRDEFYSILESWEVNLKILE